MRPLTRVQRACQQLEAFGSSVDKMSPPEGMRGDWRDHDSRNREVFKSQVVRLIIDAVRDGSLILRLETLHRHFFAQKNFEESIPEIQTLLHQLNRVAIQWHEREADKRPLLYVDPTTGTISLHDPVA